MLLSVKLKRCLKKKAEFEHAFRELFEAIKIDMEKTTHENVSDFMKLEKSYISQTISRGIDNPIFLRNFIPLRNIAIALIKIDKKMEALKKLL